MKQESNDLQDIYSGSWRKQKKGSSSDEVFQEDLNTYPILRLAPYIRLSPTGDEREEGSLVSHPQRIEDFIAFKNRQAPSGKWGEIVDWYVDKDQSGKDLNRPSFQKLCKDIEAGLIDAVIVTELSRLSRKVKDFCHIWDFLKDHNVKFLSLKENFDTSTPMGELMLIQAISFAQFERETIVERIRNGARARAVRGLANGCVPLGFNLVIGKANHREINEDEKPYVQLIFRKMLELKKIAKLLAYLNQNDYKTKEYTTKEGIKKGGRRWTSSTLHNVLTNRAYIGQREFNKKNRTKNQATLKKDQRYFFTDAQWSALIEENKFFEVQRLLEHNKKKARKYVYSYKLTGLVTCAECGLKLFGKSAKGKNSKYFYYGHSRKMQSKGNQHQKKCHLENIPAPQLEETILERLKLLANDKSLIVKLIQESHSGSNKKYDSIKSMIQSKENQKRSVNNKLDNLIDAIAECSDKMTRQILQSKVSDLETKRVSFENELMELRSEFKKHDKQIVSAGAVFKLLQIFNQGIEKQPASVQSQVFEDIVKEVIVHPEKIVLKVYGSGEVSFEHKKTRPEGGSLSDGCSFRIRSGGGGGNRTHVRTTIC